MKLSIIIPVYNERATIAEIIRQVEAAPTPGCEKEIIIVDDGSTDGTRELLRAFSARHRVVLHDKNRGKGGAIQTGLSAAGGELVLIQDADLEYDPNDYAALLAPVLGGTADVTLGSRSTARGAGARIKWRHPHPLTYLGNLLILWSIKILYGAAGTDFFSCYKIVPREWFEKLNVRADGFAYDIELICKLLRSGARFAEVPISYAPRTFAEGKKIRYSDGLKTLLAIVKWRFKRLET